MHAIEPQDLMSTTLRVITTALSAGDFTGALVLLKQLKLYSGPDTIENPAYDEAFGDAYIGLEEPANAMHHYELSYFARSLNEGPDSFQALEVLFKMERVLAIHDFVHSVSAAKTPASNRDLPNSPILRLLSTSPELLKASIAASRSSSQSLKAARKPTYEQLNQCRRERITRSKKGGLMPKLSGSSGWKLWLVVPICSFITGMVLLSQVSSASSPGVPITAPKLAPALASALAPALPAQVAPELAQERDAIFRKKAFTSPAGHSTLQLETGVAQVSQGDQVWSAKEKLARNNVVDGIALSLAAIVKPCLWLSFGQYALSDQSGRLWFDEESPEYRLSQQMMLVAAQAQAAKDLSTISYSDIFQPGKPARISLWQSDKVAREDVLSKGGHKPGEIGVCQTNPHLVIGFDRNCVPIYLDISKNAFYSSIDIQKPEVALSNGCDLVIGADNSRHIFDQAIAIWFAAAAALIVAATLVRNWQVKFFCAGTFAAVLALGICNLRFLPY